MVNSGSFDSDGDRNGKARCTHASDAATGSLLSDSSGSGDAAACKTDFSKTADSDLPSDASAIEPTPTKTEFNSSMPIDASAKNLASDGVDEKNSLCCSLPLEKIQDVLTTYVAPGNAVGEDKLKPTRKLLCLYCDRSFVSANLRQKHVERSHSAKQNRRVSARRQNQLSATPCVYCNKLNASEHTLNVLFRHLVQEHPAKYFGCLSCEERFLTSTHLVDHNTSQHPQQENIDVKHEPPVAPQIEEIVVDSLQDQEDVPLKITRSKLRNKAEDPLNIEDNSDEPKQPKIKKKKNSKLKELRNKKITVKTSKIAIKRSKRLQAQAKDIENRKKKREKKLPHSNKSDITNSTKLPEKSKSSCINPYPEFDSFYRVKKITDHSIDNLKIGSLTFDDVFDKAFFNRIKCNIEENLLHHIDGKLFKNEESESRISNFEKVSSVPQEVQNSNSENYGCELSLNAITPVASLSLNSQFGEDFESQIEYGSKPSKKKTQTNNDEVHYKYFTRRKYQASILQQKENRDLSKLDMWTQMVVKERQEKMVNDQKSAKEFLEYTLREEYKNKLKRGELNRILDRRGPFEDLKEEASKKAALDKLNLSSGSDISQEVFSDVREVLNDILNKVFEAVEEDDCPPQSVIKEVDHREIPDHLHLRRKTSTQEEIDKSDRIALICSSQETENFELPTNKVREKNELIELTGEWARSRMYICGACGGKFSSLKYLLEHKSVYHQNVWVQHYEFVGNQSELYRHLSIPGLGKVGVVEEAVQCKQWKRSDSRICTKCGKQCNSLGELHRHVLECGGDWTWMLARKKCKYRPFGAKSRRKRRGLVKRFHRKQKTEPSEKKIYKKTVEGPRQRPSDADTIQRMLANLPAKRSRRSLISLQDVVFKSRKNKQANASQNTKVKCGKAICNKQTKETNKPKPTQQRNNMTKNMRSLRSLNKVLSSRILDLNTSLMVKRKIKAIQERRSPRQRSQNTVSINTTTDLAEPYATTTSRKRSPKKLTRNIEEPTNEFKTATLNNKKSAGRMIMASRLNIKSFFPIKKKNVKSLNKTTIIEGDPINIEMKEQIKGQRKIKDVVDKDSKENSDGLEVKNTKKGGLKGFVRALSLRKRNPKKDTENPKLSKPKSTQKEAEISDSKFIEPKKDSRSKDKVKLNSPIGERNEESDTTKVTEETNQEKNISKKRKLQRSFRNVVNKIKKIKTDKISRDTTKVPQKKSETQENTFLEEKNLHLGIMPQEKVAIPAEVKENVQGIEGHAPIVASLSDSKENPPIPETIFNLTNDEEKSLQAKGELDFDNKESNLGVSIIPCEDMPITSAEQAEATFSIINPCSKTTPVTIDTSIKPKCVPLISPNIKGKIRKPNRGLNDCIAMLTNKLQQKDDKLSSSLESLFSTSSTTSTEIRPLTIENSLSGVKPQKSECILKIPTFRATASSVIEETALDLSKKSFSSPNLLFSQCSDMNIGDIESTINKVIEGVIEHKCKEVLNEKLTPTWTSVDDIIQQVVNNSSEVFRKPIDKKNMCMKRTTVDDTIDFVVSFGVGSCDDWLLNHFETKEKIVSSNRKSRRRKHSDDNLIKGILLGKDKLIIDPTIGLQNSEFPIITTIKEKESYDLYKDLANDITYIKNTIQDNVENEVLVREDTLSNIASPKKVPVTEESYPVIKTKKHEEEDSTISENVVQCTSTDPKPSICNNTTLSKSKDKELIKNKALNDIGKNISPEKRNTASGTSEIESNQNASNPEELVSVAELEPVKKKVSNSSSSNNSLVILESEGILNSDISLNGLLLNQDTETSLVTNKTFTQPRKRGRGRKRRGFQSKTKQKNPILETNFDNLLNLQVVANVDTEHRSCDKTKDVCCLEAVPLKCDQILGLTMESGPILLDKKDVLPKLLLPSDSEDDLPLAILAKQDENKNSESKLCQNNHFESNVLQTLKSNDSEKIESKLGNFKENETVSESPTSKALEEISNEKEIANSDSEEFIVENLITDSMKENLEHPLHINDDLEKVVDKMQTHENSSNVLPEEAEQVVKQKPVKPKRGKIRNKKSPFAKHRKNKPEINILPEAPKIDYEFVALKKPELEEKNPQNIEDSITPKSTDTAMALSDTTKENSVLEATQLGMEPKEPEDAMRKASLSNESATSSNSELSNIFTDGTVENCPSKDSVCNEPIKLFINTQRTRRKSKSSKKIDKVENDLFKDFSLVINKKTKRIPPTNIVDDSVCDDVLDTGINLLIKHIEDNRVEKTPTSEEPLQHALNDSVEEMDMEIEDIPMKISIIERNSDSKIEIQSENENKRTVINKDSTLEMFSLTKDSLQEIVTKRSARKESISEILESDSSKECSSTVSEGRESKISSSIVLEKLIDVENQTLPTKYINGDLPQKSDLSIKSDLDNAATSLIVNFKNQSELPVVVLEPLQLSLKEAEPREEKTVKSSNAETLVVEEIALEKAYVTEKPIADSEDKKFSTRTCKKTRKITKNTPKIIGNGVIQGVSEDQTSLCLRRSSRSKGKLETINLSANEMQIDSVNFSADIDITNTMEANPTNEVLSDPFLTENIKDVSDNSTKHDSLTDHFEKETITQEEPPISQIVTNNEIPKNKFNNQKLVKRNKKVIASSLCDKKILDAIINSDVRRSTRKKKLLEVKPIGQTNADNDDKQVKSIADENKRQTRGRKSLTQQPVEGSNDVSKDLFADKLVPVETETQDLEIDKGIKEVFAEELIQDIDNSNPINETLPVEQESGDLEGNIKQNEVKHYDNNFINVDVIENSGVSKECILNSINSINQTIPFTTTIDHNDLLKNNHLGNFFETEIDRLLPDVPNIVEETLPVLSRSTSMEEIILENKSIQSTANVKPVRPSGKTKKRKGKRFNSNNMGISKADNMADPEQLLSEVLNSIVMSKEIKDFVKNDVENKVGQVENISSTLLLEKGADANKKQIDTNIFNLLEKEIEPIIDTAEIKISLTLEEEKSAELKNIIGEISNCKTEDHKLVQQTTEPIVENIDDSNPRTRTNKSNTAVSLQNVFNIFDKTLHQNSLDTFSKQKNKSLLEKNLSFTALKNALRTIRNPGKKNKHKKTEDVLSDMEPFTEILTSSDMDIAPVIDEIDKSLESDDIYDFIEDEPKFTITGKVKGRKAKIKAKIKSSVMSTDIFSTKLNVAPLTNLEDKLPYVHQTMPPMGRRSSHRSAKVKALENLHEKALTEFNEFEVKSVAPAIKRQKKSIKKAEISNLREKDTVKSDKENKLINSNDQDDKSSIPSLIENESFSFQEDVPENIIGPLEENIELALIKLPENEELGILEKKEISSRKASKQESVDLFSNADVVNAVRRDETESQAYVKSRDLDNVPITTNKNNEPVPEIPRATENAIKLSDNFNERQELRRSRRGSRKVPSYNENDLIDPLIDALENRRKCARKEKLIDTCPGKKDPAKEAKSIEKPKLNSEDLFDLLKSSSYENENLNILKPRNSFLENLNAPNSTTDFNDINYENELDNILEQPSLILNNDVDKSKDVDKIYEFTDSPENTDEIKEELFSKNKKKRQISACEPSGIIGSLNISVDNSTSFASSAIHKNPKSKETIFEKPNYCDICKKSFTKVENLIKHKGTLTHITKLSEIEAKEAEEKAKLENEKQPQETEVGSLLKSTDSLKNEINITDILQQSEKIDICSPRTPTSLGNSHSLKLADIISDVLNKPVLEHFNSDRHSFTEMTMQKNEGDLDIRRYKSLGERKSFDSDNSLVSPDNTILSDSYLQQSISKTTILEKQISLLENIIENKLESMTDNKTEQNISNFIDDISSSSNISCAENNSCGSNGSTFNLNAKSKLENTQTDFIKPNQYEEISEDSANARVYEDPKLRKTLNRDEELFLECCSLLKSGSEVSNSNNYTKNCKNPQRYFRESDEPDLLEHKKLIQTVEEAHEYSDNSRTPTPLGDTYDDEASNSNTISSNWNLKSEKALDENRSFSFEEVINKEENDLTTAISFGEILSKGLKNQFGNISKTENRNDEVLGEERKDDSDGSINEIKKIITKGARKVFEGLKVSIPTEELNLDVLNHTQLNRKSEITEPVETTEEQHSASAKPRSTRKSKPVKKSQIGSNLLFKINKKKTFPQPNSADKEKQDVYNFEETHDTTEVFTKPSFRSVKGQKPEAKKDLVSDNDSQGYTDSIGADAHSVSSVSSLSIMSTKKQECSSENITKKKYMIMGKIFKNAAKCKMDEIDEELRHIPEIPEIDNIELVENYVLSCSRMESPLPPPPEEMPKKPKMTEEEMNMLFDQLLGKKLNEQKSENKTTQKNKTESKNGDLKKKVKPVKNRKRARNSESSDDEFNINRTTKKRTSKKNNKEDSGINLEQELKECIGVASRKSQRKCTSGKQNVLVEYWSSDEEAFEALLETQKVKLQFKNADSIKEEGLNEPALIENEPSEIPEKPEQEKLLNVEPVKPKPVQTRKPAAPKKPKSTTNKATDAGAPSTSRRKRAAANPLYHWSSSSEDESQALIEIKPIREEEDEEDRPIQHGWIVGDSPKKLVTMLALTKGKKTEVDSVKEQGKRRTSSTVS